MPGTRKIRSYGTAIFYHVNQQRKENGSGERIVGTHPEKWKLGKE